MVHSQLFVCLLCVSLVLQRLSRRLLSCPLSILRSSKAWVLHNPRYVVALTLPHFREYRTYILPTTPHAPFAMLLLITNFCCSFLCTGCAALRTSWYWQDPSCSCCRPSHRLYIHSCVRFRACAKVHW